jgi:hypothetical protein
MLIQIIVAIVAGSGAIIFGMRRKIMAFFKKNKNNTATIVRSHVSTDSEGDIVDMLADENKNKE